MLLCFLLISGGTIEKKKIWLFYLAVIIGMKMALKYFKETHAKEAFRFVCIATGSRIMISG